MPVVPMRVRRCGWFAATGIFAALLVPGSALANHVVQFDITVAGGTGGPFNTSFNQTGIQQGTSQVYNYHVADSTTPGGLVDQSGFNEWAITHWDFNADFNPAGSGAETGARLGSVFTVENRRTDTNNAGENHLQFSIMVTLDVLAAANTEFFGNGGMTLRIDEGGASNLPGELRATTTPVWNFLIDGSDSAGLFEPGFVMGGGGPSTASASANLSPAQTGPLAGMSPDTISVRLDFDLTPGERVTFDGVFGFVPSPGAAMLLGLAGLFGRPRRRR